MESLQYLFYLVLFTLIYNSALNNCQESVTRSFSKILTVASETDNMLSKFVLSPFDNEAVNDAHHYAICKRLDSEFLSCNVTLESWPFAHGTLRSQCAGYKINFPEKNDDLYPILTTVRSRNDSKVFLNLLTVFSEDRNHLKYEVHLIDMSKCIEVANFKMNSKSVDNDSPKCVYVYNNVVEIGYADAGHCNDKSSCKISYDYNGKIIGETKPFNLKYLQFDTSPKTAIPVNRQNPGNGYYVIERDVNNMLYAVSYVDSAGEGKKQISNWSPDGLYHVASSCAHERYARCFKKDVEHKTVHCALYDTQDLKINITFNLPNTVEWLAVRDLSDGGFVLVTGSCTSENDLPNNPTCKEFRIQRVSADGQMYKALDIDELELSIQHSPPMYQAVISENDNDEFCIFWRLDNRQITSLTKWCVPTKYTLVRD